MINIIGGRRKEMREKYPKCERFGRFGIICIHKEDFASMIILFYQQCFTSRNFNWIQNIIICNENILSLLYFIST